MSKIDSKPPSSMKKLKEKI